MANFHLARDGQQIGVFEEQEISAGLQTGRFTSDDLLWTEGMTEWQPVASVIDAAPLAAVAVQAAPSMNPYAAPKSSLANRPVAADYELAGLGQRFFAAFLDALIPVCLVAIPAFIFESLGKSGTHANAEALFILLPILAIMTINLIFLTTRGQTVGKRIIGIRIVTYPDAEPAGFVKAVLLRAFVNGVITAIPFVGAIYSLADILSIFRADRRCFHDQLAGTQVIKGQPS